MEFNIKTYLVKEGDTYNSVARILIKECAGYKEYLYRDSFVNAVEKGLRLVLRNKTLVAGEKIKVIDNVQYYVNVVLTSSARGKKQEVINEIETFGETLYFDVRQYREYANYNWKEDAENGEFYDGEMGHDLEGYNGDKLDYIPADNGYLYVFDTENKLKYAFELKNGVYRELRVTERNCNYDKPIGEGAPCAIIKKFITDNPEDDHHNYRFVFSKVKLSNKRLCGDEANGIPKIDARYLYRKVPILRYKYLDIEKEPRIGAMLLKEYRGGGKMPELETYHLSPRSFKGYGAGVSIFYPDPLAELTRRAKIFQKRFEDKYDWENKKSRVQQLFLYTTVKTLIEKDSGLERYADTERMEMWYNAYNKELVRHTRKVHNAATNLIKWLDSYLFYNTLFNYLSSDDRADWDHALEAYNNALIYLKDCHVGRSFLIGQISNRKSFVNKFLGLDSRTSGSSGKSSIEIILNDAYVNQNEASDAVFTLRKLQQSVFNIASNFVPAILYYRGEKVLEKFAARLTQISTGGNGVLNKKMVVPLQKISTRVNAFDLNALRSSIDGKLNGKVAAGVVGFVEIVNIYYCVKVLIDDSEHKSRNVAALFGAVLDFTSGVADNRNVQSWLLKVASRNLFIKSASTGIIKKIPVLNCISGAVDFFVGADMTWDAYQDGEMSVATGFALYGVGGALIAVGAGAIILGGETAVVSMGFGSVPAGAMIATGMVLQFVGLAISWYWDNRDVKDWIDESIFGNDVDTLKEKYPKIFEGNNEEMVKGLQGHEDRVLDVELIEVSSLQINAINNIMCDFSIDVDFKNLYSYRTRVTVTIEPGLITDDSFISFSNMQGYAEARWAEYFQFSDGRDNLAMGKAGAGNPTIEIAKELDNPHAIELDKNGRITKVKQDFYFDMDIDRLEGKITLDLNKGTLQGLTKELNETAAFYE